MSGAIKSLPVLEQQLQNLPREVRTNSDTSLALLGAACQSRLTAASLTSNVPCCSERPSGRSCPYCATRAASAKGRQLSAAAATPRFGQATRGSVWLIQRSANAGGEVINEIIDHTACMGAVDCNAD